MPRYAAIDIGSNSIRDGIIAGLCRHRRKPMPPPMHSGYQSLPAEERRILMMMIPILRLADNLDRSRGRARSSGRSTTGRFP